MRRLIVCTLALTLLSAVALGVACNRNERGDQTNTNQINQQQQTFPDPQSAAAGALATFRTLVTAQNYRDFGFESADEIGSATLGAPLRIFRVRLDQLREYQPGSDPNRLLVDINQMSYPVLTRQQVRSSVVVQQTGGGWRATTYGHGGLAQQIAAVRKAPAAGATAPDAAGQQQFLVHVAALGLYFLGQREGEALMLTPVVAPPGSNLRAGTATRAEEVFAALVPLARAQRRDAPM